MRKTPILLALILLSSLAAAQDAGQAPPVNAAAETKDASGNPKPASGFKIDSFLVGVELKYGRTMNYESHRSDDYFRLTYNDRTLREYGRSPSAATLDQGNDVRLANGDPGLLISYLNGIGTLGGSLFDANSVRPLSFKGFKVRDLNLAANVGYGFDDDEPVDAKLGIQTRTFNPLRYLRVPDVANWVLVGLNDTFHDERHEDPKNVGQAYYRAFAATALYRRNVPKEDATIRDWARQNAPSYPAAEAYFHDHPAIDAEESPESVVRNAFDTLQAAAQKPVGDPKRLDLTDANLANEIERAIVGQAAERAYFPYLTLYGEAQGEYGLTHDVLTRRYNSLWAVGAQYRIVDTLPQTVSLELRYEHGYLNVDRVSSLNNFSLTLNVKF